MKKSGDPPTFLFRARGAPKIKNIDKYRQARGPSAASGLARGPSAAARQARGPKNCEKL